MTFKPDDHITDIELNKTAVIRKINGPELFVVYDDTGNMNWINVSRARLIEPDRELSFTTREISILYGLVNVAIASNLRDVIQLNSDDFKSAAKLVERWIDEYETLSGKLSRALS